MSRLSSSLVAEGTGARKSGTDPTLCPAEKALVGILWLDQGLPSFSKLYSPRDYLNADSGFTGLR